MKTLGIDIGTTSICFLCYDWEKEAVLWTSSEPNSFIGDTYEQDPEEILQKVRKQLREMEESGWKPEEISGIGISSQMHGILYVDREGKAVSNLYTWKDEKGNEIYQNNRTYAEYLRKKGLNVHSGYGMVTHFYLTCQHEIPQNAVAFAGIGDYLAMVLTGRKEPAVNRTMADSFGGFDPERGCFCREKLEAAGIDMRFCPQISEQIMIGKYQGIPVSCACGDNQASFLGAVEDPETQISVNVGTGSQVSVWMKEKSGSAECDTIRSRVEIRPFPEEGVLCVGSSLNGGKVYERFAAFLEEIVLAFTGKRISAYPVMQKIGEKEKKTDLIIQPLLYGERQEEENRVGAVRNLTDKNFHLDDWISAYVKGMAEELKDLYLQFPEYVRRKKIQIVASGNGIRKNVLLQKEIEKLFGMKVLIQEQEEEAAYGAAKFIRQSLVSERGEKQKG